MAYDPAWDMPKVNWRQQGSFEEAITPLEDGPADGPLVCLPPINQHWLPLVLGCLDQLCNPSTWLAADDASLNTALEQAQSLKQMFGVRVECVSYKVRFDPSTCQLQESEDGGTTWSEIGGWGDFDTCLPPQTLISYDSGCVLSESLDGGATYTPVPGWIDNFSQCVQRYTPIIGLPPNPGDQAPDQLACSIATYLAEQVIVAAMGKAVTAISDDLTLLQFGLDVVNIIPEFVLVTLAADAFSAIYVAVQEGTLSDFEDALTDSTLLTSVKCAIYSSIVPDGYVTPENFAEVIAGIGDISYPHADVIAAIVAYLNALGPTGLAQLSQVAGLEQGADCSSCSDGWCASWDFTESDGGWTALDQGSGPEALWVTGIGWTQIIPTTGGVQCRIISPSGLTAENVVGMSAVIEANDGRGSADRLFFLTDAGIGVGTSPQLDGTGTYTAFWAPNLTGDQMWVYLNSPNSTDTLIIRKATIRGTGSSPWPANPC